MKEEDIHFLKLAFRAAHDLSQDANTQTGAVIVKSSSGFIPVGANRMHYGFPERFERGMPESKRVLVGRPKKYTDLIHAERDAVYCAVRGGVGDLLKRATLYCTWTPCMPCAEVIANNGIKRVVTHSYCDQWYSEKLEDSRRVKWDESIAESKAYFKRAGVSYECLDVPLTGIEIRFDDVVRKL